MAWGAHAHWSPGAQEWAREFNTSPSRFRDGDAASVWGAAQSRKGPEPKLRKLSLAHPAFTRPLDVTVAPKLDRKGDVMSAPVMIFFPGIFSGPTGPGVLRAIRNYGARGYHVVSVPNSWSKEYIESHPSFLPGTLDREVGVILDLLPQMFDEIGRSKITSYSIAGESYGGFLSMALLALGSEAGRLPEIRHLTSFGAPIHAGAALNALDRGIAAYRPMYDTQCGGSYRIWAALDLLGAESERDFNPRTARCVRPLLYGLFQDLLQKTAELVHRDYHVGHVPTAGSARREWRRTFDFGDFARGFLGQDPNAENPVASGLYWIRRLTPELREKVRVLSAADDFLNAGLTRAGWVGEGALAADQLIVLEWGGHVGFASFPEFQKILSAEFNP